MPVHSSLSRLWVDWFQPPRALEFSRRFASHPHLWPRSSPRAPPLWPRIWSDSSHPLPWPGSHPVSSVLSTTRSPELAIKPGHCSLCTFAVAAGPSCGISTEDKGCARQGWGGIPRCRVSVVQRSAPTHVCEHRLFPVRPLMETLGFGGTQVGPRGRMGESMRGQNG